MQVVSSRFSIKNGYKIDVAKANGAYLNLENILKMDRNSIVERYIRIWKKSKTSTWHEGWSYSK